MRILGYDLTLNKREALDPNIRPDDDKWYSPFLWAQNSTSGMIVNEQTAMRLSVVYACVMILAKTLASTPLFLYKRVGDGKQKATSNALYSLMRNMPCKKQRLTSSQFRMMMMIHYLLTGNGYAQKIFTNDGQLDQLAVLNPKRTKPRFDEDLGYVVFDYTKPDGRTHTLDYDEVMHLRGWSFDGYEGVSPITFWKEIIGLGLAAESFGSNFFGNSATPAGVLQLGPEMELSDPARERLKADFKKKYSGVSRAGEVAILEEGVEWKQLGIPSKDAQFIESRKFQVEEICRVFQVPPHMVAELSRSTNNNIEHQGIEFLTLSMLPHFTLFEETLHRDLLDGRENLFFEFLVNGIMRGDIATRYRAYAVGRQWGWLSINDIRAAENLNSIGNAGDIYLSPLNMVNVEALEDPTFGLLPEPDTSKTKEPDEEDDSKDEEPKPKREEELPEEFRDDPELLDNAEKVLADYRLKASKRAKNSEKPAENRDFLQDSTFLKVRAAQLASVGELIGRILRKEESTLHGALKSPQRQEKLDSLYSDLPRFARATLRNVVIGYVEQVRLCAKLNRCATIEDEQVYSVADGIITDLIAEHFSRKEERCPGQEELGSHIALGLLEKVEQHTLNM